MAVLDDGGGGWGWGVMNKRKKCVLIIGNVPAESTSPEPERFFSKLLIHHAFLTDKEKAGPFSRPYKTDFRFGNKGCAIVRIWEHRMCYITCFL